MLINIKGYNHHRLCLVFSSSGLALSYFFFLFPFQLKSVIFRLLGQLSAVDNFRPSLSHFLPTKYFQKVDGSNLRVVIFIYLFIYLIYLFYFTFFFCKPPAGTYKCNENPVPLKNGLMDECIRTLKKDRTHLISSL